MSSYTTVRAYGHGLAPGDIVNLNDRLTKVVACTSCSEFTVRHLNWLERVWLSLRNLVRLRGFWARVWNR
jgi:hypothetical protein